MFHQKKKEKKVVILRLCLKKSIINLYNFFYHDNIIILLNKICLSCMFHSILEFEQTWNFFHQLYNICKKILYETQQNGVKILVKFFSKQKIL